MYSTCLFCHASLGANEAIEHFPIGRRLAFDARRGRLWVVCRQCERWNLTPIEERWEAIEECERLFRDTRLRVSTDNIGLARLREGLELVRIGEPQRPEMAAWRYGDQFGRRRRKHLLYTGAGVATAAGLVILGPASGVIAGSSWGLWNLVSYANMAYQGRRVRARISVPGARAPVPIRLKQLERVSIVYADHGWGLRIPLSEGLRPTLANDDDAIVLQGDPALQAAARLLPAVNSTGAKPAEVRSAVDIIEEAGGPEALFMRFAARLPAVNRRVGSGRNVPGHVVTFLPKEVRLALEMATHEDGERRALEGELSVLEAAWQEAEEIAAIADDMFVSDETRAKLATFRRSEPEER